MLSRTFPQLVLAVMLLAGCSGKPAGTAIDYGTITYDKPTPAEWAQFKRLHIVFGHQSVGANLIKGLRALAQEQNVDLPIADSPLTGRDVVIRQFKIGENGKPATKLAAFRNALQQGAGAYANVAEMKFCFLDFSSPTMDPKALAATYIEQTDELAKQYPNVVFIATTSPLTTIQTGLKAWIKKLLGRQPAGYMENLRRSEFNQALRSHYGNSETLFDLAAVESLHGKSSFVVDNKTVEALTPAISSDGGHLNELGQHLLAAAWIHHLSHLKLRTDDNIPTTQP